MGTPTSDATTTPESRYDAVLRTASRFPDLPLEAAFKEDLLRLGVTFTTAALQRAACFKPKSYFIFSFDMVPLEELSEGEALHAPEEIALQGGPHAFRRTIVSVRLNPASPYRVDVDGERLVLFAGRQVLCDVLLAPSPPTWTPAPFVSSSMRPVTPTPSAPTTLRRAGKNCGRRAPSRPWDSLSAPAHGSSRAATLTRPAIP